MKIKYIKSGDFADLKANLKGNVERYAQSKPWLPDYFNNDKWYLESAYHIPENIDFLLRQIKK